MGRLRLTVMVMGLLVGVGGAALHLVPAGVARPDAVPASSVLAGVSAADRGKFKDFYAAAAEVLVRDGANSSPVIKSVFDLRNRHRNALALAFADTDMVGKYAGLGGRLDAYLLEAVGDTDVALTPQLRQSAAKAFLAIK